jgi:hypothetical protein
MAASDAVPVPRKGVAYRATFPILDADGDLVTGAASLDSEVSKDGGTFTDCTNEATEIATSSGMYYLDLTATEMTADTVAIIVKTSTSGAKTTPIVIYPEEAGDVRSDVVQLSGDSTAADNAEAFFDGTGYAGTNNTIPTVTNVTNMVTANTTQISGDSVAADNAESFFDGTGYAGTNNTIPTVTSVTNIVTANATQISGDSTAADNLESAFDGTGGVTLSVTLGTNAIPAAAIATDAITAAKIAADAIGASELATDAVTEIVTGVLTTQMTEAYNTDGTAPTLAQALFLLISALTEFSISGTTITCKKLDGSTTSMTFTLDSSSSPTSRTRAS